MIYPMLGEEIDELLRRYWDRKLQQQSVLPVDIFAGPQEPVEVFDRQSVQVGSLILYKMWYRHTWKQGENQGELKTYWYEDENGDRWVREEDVEE